MHKRIPDGTPQATVEAELMRADMQALLTAAPGAVLTVMHEDGSVSTRAFGANSKLFVAALFQAQKLVEDHFRAGGDHEG